MRHPIDSKSDFFKNGKRLDTDHMPTWMQTVEIWVCHPYPSVSIRIHPYPSVSIRIHPYPSVQISGP
jgi:hypothetical protein